MTTQNLSLFQALGSKMDFLNQRQRVLAQNISNADTPNYRPMDLVEGDFGRVLQNVLSDRKKYVTPEKTNSAHMNANGDVNDPRSRKTKEVYEVAPAGNAVIMEEQLIKSGRNVMDYNLMTNIYQKNVGMLKTALGRQQ